MLGLRHVRPSWPPPRSSRSSPARRMVPDAAGTAVEPAPDGALALPRTRSPAPQRMRRCRCRPGIWWPTVGCRNSWSICEIRRHPGCCFINSNFRRDGVIPDEAKFHFDFARAVLNIPEQLAEFNRLTYFSPTKRYAAGVLHTYQLEGRAGADLRPAVLPAGRGVRAGRRRHRHPGQGEDQHSGRQVRLRRDRIAADRRDGAGSADGRRYRGVDHRPGAGLHHLPAAQCGGGLGLPPDLPGRRFAHPGGHPGVRRAPARPVGRRRRHHEGRAGQQLPRQPEIEGTRDTEHGAARRGPRQSTVGAVSRPAGAFRRAGRRFRHRTDHRRRGRTPARRAEQQALDPAGLGAGDRVCDRTTRWPPGRRPAHSASPGSTAARPRTSGSWPTDQCWAGRRSTGRSASGSATTWFRTGFGIPLSFYRNLVDHPDNAPAANRTRRVHRRGEGRERCHRRTGPSGSSMCRPASSTPRSRRPTWPRSRRSWPRRCRG